MGKVNGHRNGTRRRRLVINTAFQLKYTVAISCVVFLICMIAGFMLYAVLHQQARLRELNPLAYRAQVQRIIGLFAIGVGLVSASAVAACSIIATHRICGPILLLQRYLTELRDGGLPRVRPLRKHDEFKELHVLLAEVVESLRKRREQELSVLTATLELTRGESAGTVAAHRDAISTLAAHIEELRNELAPATGEAEQRVIPAADAEFAAR
jgi:hypothetical protein